jgi:hypothetical protein
MSTTAVDLLTCPDCAHPWDRHSEVIGECFVSGCWCPNRRPVLPLADRLAALRAEKIAPLVSHVDDARNIVIGHTVTEARDGDDQRVGIVVERWHTADGEPGVTTVDFIHRGQEIQAVTRRFRVDELRQELLPDPDPYACSLAARKLHKIIGQHIRRNGRTDRLTDQERRFAHWADALDNAANPQPPVAP